MDKWVFNGQGSSLGVQRYESCELKLISVDDYCLHKHFETVEVETDYTVDDKDKQTHTQSSFLTGECFPV